MPSSSIFLTRLASEKRGGGWVKCCVRRHLAALQRVALRHRRQHAAVVLLGRIVGVLAVQLQEAVEGDDRAGGAQRGPLAVGHDPTVTWSSSADCICEATARFQISSYSRRWSVDRGSARRCPACGDVGRADRLVRFLGVLGLALVFARRRRQVVRAEARLDMVADRGDRLARHLHAVGPHIGDQADGLAADIDAFVELLRRAHRLLRAEAQLARGLLLQGGGGERGGGIAPDALLLDRADVELAGLDRAAWRACAACSFGRSNWSSFLPSRWVSRAVNGAPAAW